MKIKRKNMKSPIFLTTQEYVENFNLTKLEWFKFAQKCTQKEFLKSQEGFYYAVKAFPRVLAKLASQIESSEARLLVITNLWEEHGQSEGKLFHTSTYYQYLKSLGFNKEQKDIKHQPWVDEWVNLVLNKNYSAEDYAMYIAGIEFIYARISYFISQHILNYNLECDQNHYAKHSVLDYEHAAELIQTSLLIQNENQTINNYKMMMFFKLGIDEFLSLYQKMILLTEQDAFEISKEKVAFYYGREDVTINSKKLSNTKTNDILMVCSGGENAIELLTKENQNNITLLDINPYQIDLAQRKISSIIENGNLTSNLLVYNQGKFEKLFLFLKNSFSLDEIKQISKKDVVALQKLKWICDNAFSNKILEIIFTENATKYSSKSFSEHFYKIFSSQLENIFDSELKNSNIGSIFFNTPPIDYNKKINPKNNINYYNGDFISFLNKNNQKFDLIDLSNISDWMKQEDFQNIINLAFNSLKDNGVIVGRKLLGDYSWENINLSLPSSSIFTIENDNTMFYTECITIQRI